MSINWDSERLLIEASELSLSQKEEVLQLINQAQKVYQGILAHKIPKNLVFIDSKGRIIYQIKANKFNLNQTKFFYKKAWLDLKSLSWGLLVIFIFWKLANPLKCRSIG